MRRARKVSAGWDPARSHPDRPEPYSSYRHITVGLPANNYHPGGPRETSGADPRRAARHRICGMACAWPAGAIRLLSTEMSHLTCDVEVIPATCAMPTRGARWLPPCTVNHAQRRLWLCAARHSTCCTSLGQECAPGVHHRPPVAATPPCRPHCLPRWRRFRAAGVCSSHISHVPFPLYHRRLGRRDAAAASPGRAMRRRVR